MNRLLPVTLVGLLLILMSRLFAVPAPIVAQEPVQSLSQDTAVPKPSPPATDPTAAEPSPMGAPKPVSVTTAQPDTSAPPSAPVAFPSTDKTQKVRVTLLQVKPDWSQVKAAKEIEAELRAALKDVPVPAGLMESLPKSAPQILFTPEIIGLYSHEHFAQFLAWLKDRDLIESLTELPQPKSAPPIPNDELGKDNLFPRSETLLSKRFDFLDQVATQAVVSRPFLKHEQVLRCRLQFVDNAKSSLTTAIDRSWVITEQGRGADVATVKRSLASMAFEFELPDGDVAVANVFTGTIPQELLRQAAQRNANEFALIIQGSPATTNMPSIHPRFHLPHKVVPPSNTRIPFDGQQDARTGRGGRSPKGSPAMAPATTKPAATPAPMNPLAMVMAGGATKPAEVDEEIRTYALQQVDPSEAAVLVQQVFANQKIVAVSESRTNTLIVRGPAAVLQQVDALLLKLDEAAPTKKLPANLAVEPKSTGTVDIAAAIAAHKPEKLDDLKAIYKTTEQNAAELSAELRRKQAQASPGTPQGPNLQELRKELREAVRDAFTARQQLLQAEALELQQRTLQVQQSIQLRNRIQDQIIDRRVEDLLNPDRQWDAAPKPVEPRPKPASEPPPQKSVKERAAASDPFGELAEIQNAGSGTTPPENTFQALMKTLTTSEIDPDLQGEWRLNYLPEDEARVPKENRTLLVFLDGSTAVFQGAQRTGSWKFRVDKSTTPRRIYMDVCEGPQSLWGIYEVQDRGLRLSLTPVTNPFPTKFGTTRPEFKLSNAEVRAIPRESMGRIPPPRSNFNQTARTTDAEQLILRMILFTADPQGIQMLRDDSAPQPSPEQIIPPIDFEARLSAMIKAGFGEILSRPTLTTLLDQRAEVQVSTGDSPIPDSNKAESNSKNFRGFQTNLAILPTRLSDSTLQLEITWAINQAINQAIKTKQPDKVGEILTAQGDDASKFQMTVKMPNRGPVLLVCPHAGYSKREIYLYLDASPVATDPPAAAGNVDVPQSSPIALVAPPADVPAKTNPDALIPPAPRSADRTLILRNAEEYRKLLDESAAAMVQPTEQYNLVLAEVRATQPTAGESEVQKRRPDIFDNYSRVRLRQKVIRAELDAQIQLLRLELQDAQSLTAKADQSLSRIKTLVEKGVISQTEVDDATRELEQARRRIALTETLLSLYLQVEPKSTAP